MLRIGEAFVGDDDERVFNGFKKLDLNQVHEVTVPTLVLVKDCTVPVEMFDFTVQPSKEKPGKLQIIASCLGESACEGMFLRETAPFKPKSGLKLGSGYLPGVHAHTFGIIGLGSADAGKLWEEAASDSETGLIVLK